MARIRTIKPGFFKDEDLADLPPLTRLLFIGMWTTADGEGRQEYRPRFLKAEVLPYDNCDIESMLESLSKPKTGAPFIIIYEANGKRYIEIPGFREHQRISGKEAETPSEIPPSTSGEALEKSQDFPIVQEGKGMEGKGKEGNGKELISTGTKAVPPETSPMPVELSKILPTLKRVKLDKPATLFEVWSAAFPDVGIVKNILACDAWAVSKNVRRTPKGWSRTLNTWLAKEQDRVPAGRRARPGEEGYQVSDVDRIINVYREAKGIPKDDVQFRTVMWERMKPEAQMLLDYFAGDKKGAADCIQETADKCRDFPQWSWKAVMGRAPEFKNRGVAV